jgi:hypothetical protein
MTRAAWLLCALLAACPARDREPAPDSRSVPPSDRPAVLATLGPADAPGAEIVFAARGGGVAYVAERGGRFQVVHGGHAGKAYDAIAGLALSEDGRRCAYAARLGGAWRMVVDGVEGEGSEDVGSPVISPDGVHVAYEARTADGWRLVVDARRGRPSPARRLGHAFSGDSTRLAFVEGPDEEGFGRLVVSDLGLEQATVVDRSASSPVVDATGARFAAVARAPDGGRRVVTATFDRPDRPRSGPTYDAVDALALAPDGASLAYEAEQAGFRIVVRMDAAGSPAARDLGEFVAGSAWDEAEGLAYARSGLAHAYAARRGATWFLVAGGGAGPAYDRVAAPAFSPDGKVVVYRARRAGRSVVVVADDRARTVREHPAYDQVFPVRFTEDGRSVAYGVRDGSVLAWKVEPL